MNNITFENTSPQPIFEKDINIMNNITFENTLPQPIFEKDINIMNNITFENTSPLPIFEKDINIMDNITVHKTKLQPNYDITTININDIYNIGEFSDIALQVIGTENYGITTLVAEKENLVAQWGTGSDDLHFPNYSDALILENTGSTDNTFNVNYYERKEIFEMIGDSEEVSGSMLDGGSNKVFIDFNNISNFKHRNYFLENRTGFGYKSYVPQKGGGGGSWSGSLDGLINKAPIGRTSYYVTRSNTESDWPLTSEQQAALATSPVYNPGPRDLIYPPNHWTQYPTDPMVENFNRGTQIIDTKILQSSEWTDHSTSSFYSLQMEDERVLKVERGLRKTIINN